MDKTAIALEAISKEAVDLVITFSVMMLLLFLCLSEKVPKMEVDSGRRTYPLKKFLRT